MIMKNEVKSEKRNAVRPIPEGFHTVTPFLIAHRAGMLIEFITKAFDAQVMFMMKDDDDKVVHATVKIGDSMVMVADANEKFGPTANLLQLYVEDVDARISARPGCEGHIFS
jgi:uncharacterized glyoxalase superfamily protein PhnB